jgi:hypothetical protein
MRAGGQLEVQRMRAGGLLGAGGLLVRVRVADEAGICWWFYGPAKGLRMDAGCVCTHRTAQKAVKLGFFIAVFYQYLSAQSMHTGLIPY